MRKLPTVRRLRFGAPAKKGVGFVEKQDPVAVCGFVEDFGEVLFRFADIFRDNHRQVYAIDVHVVLFAEQGGRQRLARSPGEP